MQSVRRFIFQMITQVNQHLSKTVSTESTFTAGWSFGLHQLWLDVLGPLAPMHYIHTQMPTDLPLITSTLSSRKSSFHTDAHPAAGEYRSLLLNLRVMGTFFKAAKLCCPFQ